MTPTTMGLSYTLQMDDKYSDVASENVYNAL